MSDFYETEVAAPEVDEPKAAEAPESPQDEPQVSDEDAVFGNLPDDLPPELKPHLERVEGQWKSAYTKKRQEEKAQLDGTTRDLEQLEQIVNGLREGDPSTRQSFLNLLGVDQQAVLEMYGLEMAQQEAEEEDQQFAEDDLDFRDPRVDRLEAERQQELTQRQQAEAEQEALAEADQEGDFMEQEIERLYGDKEPSQEDLELVFNYAMNNRDRLNRPDVEAAVRQLKARDEARMKEWLDSRKGPRATTPGITGSPGGDTSTKEGRMALYQEAISAVNAGSQ